MARPIDPRRDRIIRLKIQVGGCCTTCGYNDNYASLDFHHVNPKEKTFNVNTTYSGSWDNLVYEAGKCKLLCRNCHSALHHPDMNRKLWSTRHENENNRKLALKQSRQPLFPTYTLPFDNDDLTSLICASAIEIDQPGYKRPFWMTDDIVHSIKAAAADQYRAFDPDGLLCGVP